ncbi:thioredoxin [Candidatus Uhrbacteria bacterium RIFCSPHIGHO2_02_FULL_57_19]|uniref:Thioredoxin n=1 Tax=Candidatus Uhrbacteria bacterium RIFCSPHIGHO2_02_FULL_57_19 TaxID=1802391 RepID=A0A1F7U6F2_9BACT|nr:MAG: thioredoxin [Candidatus Uhrbacteria bacterium RIFCSPHIGHO2_02_FULL_57_19]
MSEIILTDANFDAEVLKSATPVLVDFWAPWCGPCQVQGPIVEGLAGEMSSVKIGKLNVDENPAIAQRYNIMSIPTLMIFKGGQVAEQLVGVTQKAKLKEKLSALS